MIRIENVEVSGWDACIRGMRNPLESWDKSDSYWTYIENAETGNRAKFEFFLGENDLALMRKLSAAGDDHGKFERFIDVTCDITAPRFWFLEFDTYKVGTVSNSCSTMHRIHAKEFVPEDFSTERLLVPAQDALITTIRALNMYRRKYIAYKRKSDWEQMIGILPQSYNQKRTVKLNYQVLKHMYNARKSHKLTEWHDFCDWMLTLPYFKEICLGEEK